MSEIYFVVGGLFTDTNFDVIEDGKKITRLGPFDNYEQAQAVWRAKAMETVDEAYAKFSIERNSYDEYWGRWRTLHRNRFLKLSAMVVGKNALVLLMI